MQIANHLRFQSQFSETLPNTRHDAAAKLFKLNYVNEHAKRAEHVKQFNSLIIRKSSSLCTKIIAKLCKRLGPDETRFTRQKTI